MQYYPCSILKGRLYLGDANHATSWYVIKNMRITHIGNITNCVKNEFDTEEYDINYCQIEVEDTAAEDLTDYFP
jgi:dethiobiotin synthetase